MNKAKEAVSSFLHKDGKHDTTVHETVNPAVTNEHVTRTQQEEATKVVDREVHQDHHHTSVQPIKDREVLPEQHSHNLVGTEHREIKHGDDSHIKERLAAEAAQFKNTREVGETQHSTAKGQSITGEHVHHHVHENIQPVIQKETIQPSVVHTTIPVHEVHQNETKHHTASALPAVTMDEFKRQGGSLSGREERSDAFQGEPRSVGGALGGTGAHGSTSLTEREGHSGTGSGLTGSHNSHGTQSGTGSGLTGSQNTYGTQSGTGSGLTGHSSTTQGTHTGTGSHTGTGVGSNSYDNNNNTTGTQHKPTLMDKVNPKKDADGDGKAGFMK